MSIESNVEVGSIATVKIGRNSVLVTVMEITAGGYKVKSQSSGKEFEVNKVERIITLPPLELVVDPVEVETQEDDTPNPAPESTTQPKEKKLSLLDAAAEALKRSQMPLNMKELLAKIIESELWIPTGSKTPEQSLYSAIFREIKSKETPRFRKSTEHKGSFEFNR